MKIESRISKSGDEVFVINSEKIIAIHSLYDPVNEAKKIVSSFKSDLLFVIGTGNGNFLKHEFEGKIIFIKFEEEKSINFFDENTIFFDDNFKTNLMLKLSFFSYKNYSIFTNNAFKSVLEEKTKLCYNSIVDVIDNIFNDIAIYKKFAKNWTTNLFKNISLLDKSSKIDFCKKRKVFIVGAGPSLEKNYNLLLEKASEDIIIASDTSYPFLIKHNIFPEYVLNIDSAHISYKHFYNLDNSKTTLILDLMSSPILTTLFDKFSFVISTHPLAVLANNYLKLPFTDMSSGTVLGASKFFSQYFTPDKVITIGNDFSYPNGKSYARGTYLIDNWNNSSTRKESSETKNFNIIHRGTVNKIGNDYFNSLLDKYKKTYNEIIYKNLTFKYTDFEIQKFKDCISNININSKEILPLVYFYFYKGLNEIDAKNYALEITKRTSSASFADFLDKEQILPSM